MKKAGRGRHKIPQQASWNILWDNYRRGARRFNRIFELSKDEFKLLSTQNCHYCNCEPIKKFNHYLRGERLSITAEKKNMDIDYIKQMTIMVNGIDRKNNDIGYVLENCVACCFKCNFLKNSLDDNEFLEFIFISPAIILKLRASLLKQLKISKESLFQHIMKIRLHLLKSRNAVDNGVVKQYKKVEA